MEKTHRFEDIDKLIEEHESHAPDWDALPPDEQNKARQRALIAERLKNEAVRSRKRVSELEILLTRVFEASLEGDTSPTAQLGREVVAMLQSRGCGGNRRGHKMNRPREAALKAVASYAAEGGDLIALTEAFVHPTVVYVGEDAGPVSDWANDWLEGQSCVCRTLELWRHPITRSAFMQYSILTAALALEELRDGREYVTKYGAGGPASVLTAYNHAVVRFPDGQHNRKRDEQGWAQLIQLVKERQGNH